MTINDFNKVQVNYNVKRNAENQVVEKSTMVNIRCDSTEEAIELYDQIKKKLNGELSGELHKNEDNTNGSLGLFESRDEIGDCPKCGSQLKLRKGQNGSFWGCSNYPKCRYTKQA